MSSSPPTAVVIGGSIGGLACALSLLKIGCKVTVFERASSISAAGAGIGLDKESISILRGISNNEALDKSILEMSSEVNQAIVKCNASTITQDNGWAHHSAHWSDIHQSLYRALPQGILHFQHVVTDVQQSADQVTVTVDTPSSDASPSESYTSQHHHPDFVVAADGSMSQTRQRLRPNEQRRYSGYCAWRGVVPAHQQPEVAARVKAAYPNLGRELYFDIAEDTHAVLYTLPGNRLNWLWYVNQPEPQLKGHSVTVKADDKTIAEMHRAAAATFTPELAKLMQVTEKPFINAIYDKEPLDQLVWGRIVLIGEAAHPTTPHGLRSTNMALGDADQLRQSLAKHDNQIGPALQDFQTHRLNTTRQEVLFSRYLGQLKQGLLYPDMSAESWLNAPSAKQQEMAQRSLRKFSMSRYQKLQMPPFD